MNTFIKNTRALAIGLITISAMSLVSCDKDNEPTLPPTNDVSGTIAGHDYVDLGLPSGTLWATTNIGASTPTGFGEYYAWGEITPKADYSIATCDTWQKDIPTIQGDPNMDAATASWGRNWVTPSNQQIIELVKYCTWTYDKNIEKVPGLYATGPSGKTIFFPKAGCMNGKAFKEGGLYLWACDQYSNGNDFASYKFAFSMWCEFYGDKVSIHAGDGTDRSVGLSIRPVVNR